MRISFLGGAGTVTGAKFLIEARGRKIMVDCGLFQGLKELRLKNWAPFPLPPSQIDMVVLTHAHIDHSGYLPILIRDGFRGPVIATPPTTDLCGILLPDSGYLNEKDAEFANRYGFSKHHPAKPLYTKRDAEHALHSFESKTFNRWHDLGNGIKLRFTHSGHILGSAFVELDFGDKKITFSGDLGHAGNPITIDPEFVEQTDYLVVESTYGDRLHDNENPEDALAGIINRTAERGGSVIIPSFAVGRAQMLLYYIHALKSARRIPNLPVYLDSPMAIDASGLFCYHAADHSMSPEECRAICGVATYVNEVEDSKALDQTEMPIILISASGMATGGRVLHHLKHFAPDPENTILFAGYQAPGTRGDRMLRGEPEVKIHGKWIPIRAEVNQLGMLSAHADQNEIMAWLKGFRRAPKKTFITHGQAEAAATLGHKIEADLGWKVVIPQLGDTFNLD